MNNESLLKKEFKQSDVQRVRNLVNKDFTSATKQQSGYKKAYTHHTEGDIWEEGGKQWTIKNGIKQNITKLDSIKKYSQVPLTCPKCSGSMKHHLAKKMYKVHGFCFDCTVDFEANLVKLGLFEDYEKKMLEGNMKSIADDIENLVLESFSAKDSFVTEQGDVEDWGEMSADQVKTITSKVKEYTSYIREYFS